MELHQVLHMNKGQEKDSYAENSLFQKMVIQKSKHVTEEIIRELCDSSLPNCINIADLGCSSGPNAFIPRQNIMLRIREACKNQDRQPPSFQVFLNDLFGNDFNTLFKSLPRFYSEIEKLENGDNGKSCFIAATPGSFYGRLFPDHSIHFVHSSYSLHWLSQAPEGLFSKSGKPLNKRNIYIAKTSPPSVHDAYSNQFRKDFTMFLRMRSQEMVPSGCLDLKFMAGIGEDDGYEAYEMVGMAIDDMVKEGLIEEEKLAAFNLPVYQPSAEELTEIIESEGSFKLRQLETFKLPWDANIRSGCESGEYVAKTIRAVLEPILASHFGETIMNDLFLKFGKKAATFMQTNKAIKNNVVISLAKE